MYICVYVCVCIHKFIYICTAMSVSFFAPETFYYIYIYVVKRTGAKNAVHVYWNEYFFVCMFACVLLHVC